MKVLINFLESGTESYTGPMDDYEKSVKRHCGRIGAVEVFLSGPDWKIIMSLNQRKDII